MIRREIVGGHALILQHDHARLAAQLAQHLPATARPSERVLRAIAMHDAGWPIHDAQPTLNAQGLPLDVFESPPEVVLPCWEQSVLLAAGDDPYAGLLVSVHVLKLSSLAASKAHDRQAVFDLNCFQHRQIELQTTLRSKLGLRIDIPVKLGLAVQRGIAAEEQLRWDYAMLSAMDSLSLALLCSQVPFDQIELPGRRGAKPIALRFAAHRDGLALDPWPFAAPSINLTVPCKCLPSRPYATLAAFHAEYAAAPPAALDLCIEPAAPGTGTAGTARPTRPL